MATETAVHPKAQEDVADPRHTEEAFLWAERQIGGKLVRKEKQARWRPAYYLDFEMPDGTIKQTMMRGYRTSSSSDANEYRGRHAMEAGLCEALGRAGCKVAAFHGFEPRGGWFLMDCLPGEPLVTDVTDPEVQRSLMMQYMDAIVYMHKLDYTKMDLPDNLPVPRDYEHSCRQHLEFYRQGYDSTADKMPEPGLQLAMWWLKNHKPRPVDRWSVTTGDIGSNQFMFDGDKFVGFFDLEMGYVGDPMSDIGLTRLRDTNYPVPNFPDYLRHWAEQMGRELDRESICFWTMVAMVQGPLITYPAWIRPATQMNALRDTVFMYAYNPLYMRGATEALAEYYGLELPQVAPPQPRESTFTEMVKWVRPQFSELYPALIDDEEMNVDLQYSAVTAEMAELAYTLGPDIEARSLEEIGELLGKSFRSLPEALRALEARIIADPEKDLEKTILTLYRFEARREYLCVPAQKFTGLASHAPLQRLF